MTRTGAFPLLLVALLLAVQVVGAPSAHAADPLAGPATGPSGSPALDPGASPSTSPDPDPGTEVASSLPEASPGLLASVATTTSLASAPDPSYVDQAITLTATVVPNPGGGDVTWLESGVVIGTAPVGADGTATLERSPGVSGSFAFSAEFGGFDGFDGSGSDVLAHVVLDAATTVTEVSASSGRTFAGDTVTLTAAVTPNPGSGDIEWLSAGVSAGVTPLDATGHATLPLVVVLGEQSIEARFVGRPGFLSSAGSFELLGIAALPAECTVRASTAVSFGVTSDAVRQGQLTLYDRTVAIDPSTINLARTPFASPAPTMWYRSLVWLAPLAAEAYTTGDAAGVALVDAYVDAAYRTNPDPGSATSTLLALANSTGWDEGTNLRREEVLNCLAEIQPGLAVSRLLDATIKANLDPNRYKGLPQRPVHNHGVMANIALIESGRILGRPELIDAAQSRLLRDIGVLIDPGCGMVYEQSSGYQAVNVTLWNAAQRELTQVGRTAAAGTIAPLTTKMALAYDLLVGPNGVLPPVGDGNPLQGFRLAQHTAVRMLCRAAGWAAARGSWSSTTTSYTFRFGPARGYHGHNDHGSVTWDPGRSVLTDPGSYYDPLGAYGRYAVTNAAHNVLGVSGAELSGASSLIRASMGTSVDTFTIRDHTFLVTRTRSVRVDRGLPLLMVLDRASAIRSVTFTQRWHFASGWRWDAVRRQLVNGTARAGMVAIDLRTGVMLPTAAGSAWLFPTATTVARAPLLTTARSGTSASIFTVIYTNTTGVRPVLRWYRGPIAGTGRVRVWWGRIYRDILIDSTGIR